MITINMDNQYLFQNHVPQILYEGKHYPCYDLGAIGLFWDLIDSIADSKVIIINGQNDVKCMRYKKEYSNIVNAIYSPVTLKYNDKQIVVNAVWDTGAWISCISQSIIDQFNVTPLDPAVINNHTGLHLTNKYSIDVTIDDFITFTDLEVLSTNFSKNNIGFIIGMDIIQKGNLGIDNSTGHTILTYDLSFDNES